MTAQAAPADAEPINDAKPQGKQRLGPKLGLQGMVLFVMDLRLRARMYDGGDATRTWALLEPEDLEKLEDIADTLEWLRMERLKSRVSGGRR